LAPFVDARAVADGFLPFTTLSGFLITPFFLLPGYNIHSMITLQLGTSVQVINQSIETVEDLSLTWLVGWLELNTI